MFNRYTIYLKDLDTKDKVESIIYKECEKFNVIIKYLKFKKNKCYIKVNGTTKDIFDLILILSVKYKDIVEFIS